MENNTFKSVTFGGFDKQDVITYIEQTARDTAAAQESLERENEQFRAEAEEAKAQVRQLTEEVQALTDQQEKTRSRLEEAEGERGALEQVRRELTETKAELERLRVENERFRHDAEAYAQFRDRIGDIECDAHKRAAELETTTIQKMEQVLRSFRAQYQELMTTFETASAHVTGELRKVEVNLTQLPRAMDQTGAELEELSAVLDRAADRHES